MRGRSMVNFLAKTLFACSATRAVGSQRPATQSPPQDAPATRGGSMLATLMTNRIRRGSEWALRPRACAGVLIVLLSGLVAGCIVIPRSAKVEVAQSGDVLTPSGGIALSVLFSRDFSPETLRSFGEEMVECVAHDLAKAAPKVRLVPEEEFHRAIFGVKPGEVLLRADTIKTLLARPDIRQRVAESGLTHLILLEGATGSTPVSRNRGVGSARVEWMRSTRLTASIFELASGQVGHVVASAEGSQGGGAVGGGPAAIFFVWFTPTESPSCRALSAEIAQAIRGNPSNEHR